MRNYKSEHKVIDTKVVDVLAEDRQILSDNFPKITLLSGNGQSFFKMMDVIIPLDLTSIDLKGLGVIYSQISAYASYAQDELGYLKAKVIVLRQSLLERKSEVITTYTKGKSQRDLKPTLINKLVDSDEALVELSRSLSHYEAVISMLESRLQSYETRIKTLSREFSRRGIKDN